MIVLHPLLIVSLTTSKNKIELIHSNLEESLNTFTDQFPSTAPTFHGLSFEDFRIVSESDVRKVITSSPTKSCALEPIPTWLLKQCFRLGGPCSHCDC